MGWLQQEGVRAVEKRAKAYLRGLTNEIKKHIDESEERIMTELSRLSDAVTKELADDASQNELIDFLKSQLTAAQDAAAAAAAGEADANARLDEALAAASEAADRLGSNDAVEEPPVDESGTDEGTTEEPNV
jgi:hypothetical protein